MVSLSDNSTPSTLEPPPASDSRLAQPGSPYKASGRLGVWWIATLPGVVAGACAGLVAGSLAGERFFAVTRVGATPKAIIVVLLILIGVVAIITGVCTRVGRVRSAWFTFLMGLSGGVTFAALGLCAFAARGVGIGGANGGFSAVISKAWAYFSDWSAFDAALTTAVPNATTRVIILVVAGIAAGAVGGATVFIHGLITEGEPLRRGNGRLVSVAGHHCATRFGVTSARALEASAMDPDCARVAPCVVQRVDCVAPPSAAACWGALHARIR